MDTFLVFTAPAWLVGGIGMILLIRPMKGRPLWGPRLIQVGIALMVLVPGFGVTGLALLGKSQTSLLSPLIAIMFGCGYLYYIRLHWNNPGGRRGAAPLEATQYPQGRPATRPAITKRRGLGLILLVAFSVAWIAWNLALPSAITYYRVIDANTIALGTSAAATDQIQFRFETLGPGKASFGIDLQRPWFSGQVEQVVSFEGVSVYFDSLTEVIDLGNGQRVPRR